ncbi:MAG: hypothetical protein J1E36_05155 [Eubacterium sp.]|nr:hypothetical protein [Eubacterium sp.]
MSESLSIEEILKQAEEIRKKTIKTAQSTMKDIDSSAREMTEKPIEVPKVEPENIVVEKKPVSKPSGQTQKTAVVDNDAVKKAASDNDGKTRVVDQKTRPVTVAEKTGVIENVGDIKKKKSFFSSQSDEPLYSRRPPEIIERPATIRSKSRFDKTSDLEELPTIVAVDELEHTKISPVSHIKPDEQYSSDEGEQIVLAGFEDVTEEVAKIDEEVAEKQLKERRREKVNKFRLFSPDEMDSEAGTRKALKGEYENDDEKTSFMEKLFASKSSVSLTAILTFVLSLLLGLLTFFKDSAYMPSFLLDYTAYFTALTVLYAVILIINFKTIIHGFKLKNGINSDFPIAIVSLVVLAHTVLMLVNSNVYNDSGNIYPLAAAFALFLSSIGKIFLISRLIENFEFLTGQEETHTVEDIVNAVDATIISRGILTGEPSLKTSIKTDFPTKFLDIGCSDEPADKIAKITGMVMLGLNVILFAVFSIINNNWHIGLNFAVCGMCISVPCISLFNTNSALLGISKTLKNSGAMINGFEGAKVVDNTNAIVIEAQDLFGPNSCEIHGIKTFNGAKADDVILKTAAVIMKTKSPLSYVFDDVVIGKQTILPDVDGVVYEDRLGTSAWIYRKKILVGTRDLLIHHGVQVPREEYETKYKRKGRKILYLAVTGKVMAMFVVSYNADPSLKRALRKLEKSGMTILVKSSDPFINEESIAELFSLPDGFVRVMNSSNGRAFEKYSDMCVEKSPAYVVHDGSALGFVSAMSGAENIEDTRKLLSVLISFGCALGFGVAMLLGIMGGIEQLGAVNIVIFQALWCIFVEIVSKIKRLGL